MTTKKRERNALGDVIFPSEKINRAEMQTAKGTYVFKYYDATYEHHFPHYDVFTKGQLGRSKSNKGEECHEVILYKSPDNPPFDFYIRYSNWQLSLLIEHFKEVFNEKAFEQGVMPSHEYFRILMPKSIYVTMMECINKYELMTIRDLLFEIIAIAQKIYTSDISFWEEPENKKLITTAEKETAKVIDILERTDTASLLSPEKETKRRSKLLGINFVFADGPVKLEHPWLAGEFIEHFREYYNNLPFKDWRKDVKRYPARFDEDKDKLQFRFRLANSFYTLLTETGLFDVKGKAATPNRLMLCIGELMEFCLIPVAEEGETDAVKAKIVRNWISRYKLEKVATHAEIEYSLERLQKYFTNDFLDFGDEVKRVDALYGAAYIASRFDLIHLSGDLAHIIQCLQQMTFYIGHQITGLGTQSPADFPEFESFKQLLLSRKKNISITSLKFTIEGSDQEHTLNSVLPLTMVSEALNNYLNRYRVDIDTEVYEAKVERMEDNSVRVTTKNRFPEPKNRFMVQFVQLFYAYLLNEVPPTERDYKPSERYYGIIANVMIHSGCFYSKGADENFAVYMVKKWHRLSQTP